MGASFDSNTTSYSPPSASTGASRATKLHLLCILIGRHRATSPTSLPASSKQAPRTQTALNTHLLIAPGIYNASFGISARRYALSPMQCSPDSSPISQIFASNALEGSPTREDDLAMHEQQKINLPDQTNDALACEISLPPSRTRPAVMPPR
ncbi:hypothetical protein VTI74DRAFT_10256 [Chaetomium olivicolor]